MGLYLAHYGWLKNFLILWIMWFPHFVIISRGPHRVEVEMAEMVIVSAIRVVIVKDKKIISKGGYQFVVSVADFTNFLMHRKHIVGLN